MNIKGLLGRGKESALQIEALTKVEPVAKAERKKKAKPALKAEATKKWMPKPAGKGAKSRRRF